MIPEDQQDLAALYALGSLDPNEVAAFETSMGSDPELRALVRDLRESMASLALSTPSRQPSTAVKQRVLREIAVEKTGGAGDSARPTSWLPWAIAALFMISCGVLLYDRAQVRRELAEARVRDPFAEMNFVTLAPQKDAPPEARAIVAWRPSEQTGIIRVSGLPLVSGKDYQLWAVDEDHKDPVSAGIVHVESNGVAQVRFKTEAATNRVKAFALTLEREGGVPKAEGPILLVGNT